MTIETASKMAVLRRQRRRAKPATIIANEIILFELEHFLTTHYVLGGGGRMLDLGAGHKPYAPLYEPFFSQTRTVDVATSPHDVSTVDVIASADALPFEQASFDCVICTEVLEHCRDPRATLHEVRRVLRPGGHAFVTTPFFVALHEMPFDYYRFTPSALTELAQNSGLEVTALRPRGEYFAVVLSLLHLPLSKAVQRASRAIGIDLYRPINPLVFFAVTGPQRLYVVMWRRAQLRQRDGVMSRTYRRMSYYTLGYTTILRRPIEVEA